MTLKEQAGRYYLDEGRSCAEAMLLAARDVYGLDFTESEVSLFAGFRTGMGCGSTCGGLTGAIGVLSRMYGSREDFNALCGEFVSAFEEKLACNTLDCAPLAAKYKNELTRCTAAVELSADALEAFIDKLEGRNQPTAPAGEGCTLTADQMSRLLTRLNTRFDLSHVVEYTVEAGRPDTITEDKLRALKNGGVSRVSINPQSMEDKVLTAIGRRHSSDDIRAAMELVKKFDFPHVNMDLIAGLPEDTPEGFRRTLDEVIAFGTDNITIHTLSLKKGSRITLEGTRIPTVDEVAAMLDYADPTLRRAAFAPYYLYRQKYMSGSFENVGWCKEGGTGWYNIYIMEELHTILSLGAGGSTKLVDPKNNRIERVFNLKYPKEYIDRAEKIEENQKAVRLFYSNR